MHCWMLFLNFTLRARHWDFVEHELNLVWLVPWGTQVSLVGPLFHRQSQVRGLGTAAAAMSRQVTHSHPTWMKPVFPDWFLLKGEVTRGLEHHFTRDWKKGGHKITDSTLMSLK